MRFSEFIFLGISSCYTFSHRVDLLRREVQIVNCTKVPKTLIYRCKKFYLNSFNVKVNIQIVHSKYVGTFFMRNISGNDSVHSFIFNISHWYTTWPSRKFPCAYIFSYLSFLKWKVEIQSIESYLVGEWWQISSYFEVCSTSWNRNVLKKKGF